LLVFPYRATPSFSTLSLHDALPIYLEVVRFLRGREVFEADAVAGELRVLAAPERRLRLYRPGLRAGDPDRDDQDAEVDAEAAVRSEEHTSELQSPDHLVCRLLLEKK